MTPERWQQVKGLFLEAQQVDEHRREAFLHGRCGDDLALLDEVVSLLAAAARGGEFLATGTDGPAWLDTEAALAVEAATSAAGLAGQRLGPYQLLRRIGRGGMGEVYLAERVDAAYEKQVAVKVVRADGETAVVRQRLHEERQILARLEHPNIARLLDAGTTDDGRPFFVMEYVEGEPILRYCDARRLPVRGRLELFRTVCAAVHHAHQNLIVHRDLKPGNVLVTPSGEAKLLDFGIAKLLRSDAGAPDGGPTVTAQRFLTPVYSSPEQLRGEPITTAADVYSLGVMLYELLTGRRPLASGGGPLHEAVAAQADETPLPPSVAVARAAHGPADDTAPDRSFSPETAAAERDTRPDTLRRQLTGDLDMVVLMALRKEPPRRYASADQLAEDVRRYLAGLPVRARRDTLGYRFDRFVRRHRGGVAAAALAAAGLVAGVAGIVWQARVAQAERARAERRFEDVRQLANAFIFDVHDAIEPIPGTTRARQVVVAKALEYLDRLYQESSGDPALQADLALAYQRVGDVQGLPYTANLGDTPGALASYRRALSLREALAAAGDAKARRAVSVILNRIGQVLLFNRDPAGARGTFERSVAIAEDLARSGTADARRDLEIAYLLLADALLGARDLAASTEYHQRAVALAEQVHRERGDDQSVRDLANAYDRMAIVLGEQGRKAEVLELTRKALAMDRAQAAARPGDLVPQRDLGVSLQRDARALLALGRVDEAVPLMEEALAVNRRLLAADPDNADAQWGVSVAEFWLAEALAARRDFTRSLEHHRRAIALSDRLIAKDPGATYQADKAESLWRMGIVLDALGRRPAALDATREAAEIYEALGAQMPDDVKVQANRVVVIARMAKLEGPGCAGGRAWLEKGVAGARDVVAREGTALLAEHQVSLEDLSRQLAGCAGQAAAAAR
jgi:eukaryotic-like serine/threonine-protein kinase